MGQGQSRILLKHEQYRAFMEEMRKEDIQNANENERKMEEYQAQIVSYQKSAQEKGEEVKKYLQKIKEDQIKNAQEKSANWFLNEAIRGYDMNIQETKDEMNRLCEVAKMEFNKVRSMQEDEHWTHLGELDRLHELLVEQMNDHYQKMEKLYEKKAEEMEKMYEEIISASRHSHNETMNMINSRFESTTNSMGIVAYCAIKNAMEKDASIENIRNSIYKIEENRIKIDDWMVDSDFKKSRAGFNAVHSLGDMNHGLAILKIMSDECSILITLIEDAKNVVPGRLIKAKISFASLLEKVSILFNELSNLVIALLKFHTINTDGIKQLLGDILTSINIIPSIIAQTTNNAIHEEMTKLSIKEVEREDSEKNKDSWM